MTAETSNARGGWVLVPREPTPEMVEMGCNCRISPNGTTAGGVIATWNAMLAAAPQPPNVPVGVEIGLLRWVKAQADDPDANPRFRELYAALSQQPAVDGCHCGTCTCNPNMTPAVRFDLSPAQKEGAIREHLVRLGWTPPAADAEAKTVPVPTRVHLIGETAVIVGTPGRGWDEDAQDAHNCDAMGCATIGPHVLARVPFTDERAMSQQPEAQGGGEVAAWETEDGRVISARQKATALRDGGASASSVAPYTTPLYRTAPPSAPVGVEASYHPCTSVLIEGLKRLEGGSDVLAEWDRARAKADTALAQQPAAGVVDDTRRIRALADNYWRLEPFDMPTPGGDDADVGWRVIEFHRAEPRERVVVEHYRDNPREAIDAALAAQHQEPKS